MKGGAGRSAAVALLVGIVMVIAGAIALPFAQKWNALDARAAEYSAELHERQRMLSEIEALSTAEAEWVAFASKPLAGFEPQDSDEAAATALQKRLELAFSERGGRLETAEAEALSAVRTGVSRIVIAARGVIPRDAFVPMLVDLETKPPFVVIESLETETSDDRLLVQMNGAILRFSQAALAGTEQ